MADPQTTQDTGNQTLPEPKTGPDGVNQPIHSTSSTPQGQSADKAYQQYAMLAKQAQAAQQKYAQTQSTEDSLAWSHALDAEDKAWSDYKALVGAANKAAAGPTRITPEEAATKAGATKTAQIEAGKAQGTISESGVPAGTMYARNEMLMSTLANALASMGNTQLTQANENARANVDKAFQAWQQQQAQELQKYGIDQAKANQIAQQNADIFRTVLQEQGQNNRQTSQEALNKYIADQTAMIDKGKTDAESAIQRYNAALDTAKNWEQISNPYRKGWEPGGAADYSAWLTGKKISDAERDQHKMPPLDFMKLGGVQNGQIAGPQWGTVAQPNLQPLSTQQQVDQATKMVQPLIDQNNANRPQVQAPTLAQPPNVQLPTTLQANPNTPQIQQIYQWLMQQNQPGQQQPTTNGANQSASVPDIGVGGVDRPYAKPGEPIGETGPTFANPQPGDPNVKVDYMLTPQQIAAGNAPRAIGVMDVVPGGNAYPVPGRVNPTDAFTHTNRLDDQSPPQTVHPGSDINAPIATFMGEWRQQQLQQGKNPNDIAAFLRDFSQQFSGQANQSNQPSAAGGVMY